MAKETQIGDLTPDAGAHVEGVDALLGYKLECDLCLGESVDRD